MKVGFKKPSLYLGKGRFNEFACFFRLFRQLQLLFADTHKVPRQSFSLLLS
jgi:hypothetical protein